MQKVRLLCACYRKDDAHDPELYAAAACAVLSEYPDDVVNHVMDPRGLATKSQWLPTIKEIKEACEAVLLENAATIRRERLAQEQIAERQSIEASRTRTPEQQARVDAQIEEWKRQKASLELEKKSERPKFNGDNTEFIEREYAAAGVQPIYASDGRLVSLELSKRISDSRNGKAA